MISSSEYLPAPVHNKVTNIPRYRIASSLTVKGSLPWMIKIAISIPNIRGKVAKRVINPNIIHIEHPTSAKRINIKETMLLTPSGSGKVVAKVEKEDNLAQPCVSIRKPANKRKKHKAPSKCLRSDLTSFNNNSFILQSFSSFYEKRR